MKAFRVKSGEIWAASTIDEVRALYLERTGESLEQLDVQELQNDALRVQMSAVDQDGRNAGLLTTMRLCLDGIASPGLLLSPIG